MSGWRDLLETWLSVPVDFIRHLTSPSMPWLVALFSGFVAAVITFYGASRLEARRERTALALQRRTAWSKWIGLQLVAGIDFKHFADLASHIDDRGDTYEERLESRLSAARTSTLAIFEAAYDLLALEQRAEDRTLIEDANELLEAALAHAHRLLNVLIQVSVFEAKMADQEKKAEEQPPGFLATAALAELDRMRTQFDNAIPHGMKEDVRNFETQVEEYRAAVQVLALNRRMQSRAK